MTGAGLAAVGAEFGKEEAEAEEEEEGCSNWSPFVTWERTLGTGMRAVPWNDD